VINSPPPNPAAYITEIKLAAAGRWLQILPALAGIPAEVLGGKHHPCPKCGGTDRFRCIDAEVGSLYCNQCFNKKNGDGIAALQWLTGQSFGEVCKSLAAYLGIKASAAAGKPKTKAEQPAKRFARPEAVVRHFVDQLAKQHGKGVSYVKSWNYSAFHVLRFNLPTPAGEKQRKEFRPCHQVPLGEILGWQIGYPDGPRPLYRLDQVNAAPAGLVTVHGGEKAADAAATLNLLTTTNAGGEQAIDKTDWAPLTRFALIVIVIDNDETGERFGKTLAALLKKLKADLDIRIIRLTGLPPKGDIVEWIAAGGTREQFIRLVESTEPVGLIAEEEPGEDDDNAHRLAAENIEEYTARGRAIHYWGKVWLTWKGEKYGVIEDGELRGKLYEFCHRKFVKNAKAKNAGREKKDHVNVKKVSNNLIKDVVTAMSGLCYIPSDVEWNTWLPTREKKPWVALQNGILDVDALLAGKTDYMRPLSPDWFSKVILPYDFDPLAKCPKWNAFLDYCLEGDIERIALLQEWAGYCLLPDTGQQAFMVLEGEGGNGKSVYIAGLTALLGPANISAVPLEAFGQPFTLSDTLGKLLNAAADCGDLDRTAEGQLKWFTGGNMMRFDRKYLPSITCKPTARLMIACNNRPHISDSSEGVFRRMKVCPWRIVIPKDKRILGMDEAEWWERSGELPGMFCWAIAGLARLRAQKDFTVCRMGEEAKEEYRVETNPARTFLTLFCEIKPGCSVLSSDVYARYSKWCKDNGYTHPVTSARFGKEIRRAFHGLDRVRDPVSRKGWVYKGISMNDEF